MQYEMSLDPTLVVIVLEGHAVQDKAPEIDE
jgi:hypothetical protein